MAADMTTDIFATYTYGKIALNKIAKLPGGIPENFRLYEAGWLGDSRQVMRVTGAQFRKAKSGPFKGRLSVMVPKTKQAAYVTAEEIEAYA